MIYHYKMHYIVIFWKKEFRNLNITVKSVKSQTDSHILVNRVVRTSSEFQCTFLQTNTQ